MKNNDQLKIEGYKFIGRNRNNLHANAKCGSGGVGLFEKQNLLNQFDYEILDTSCEDILWVKFNDDDTCFCVCVCYLPPAGSSRLNVAEEFFTKLTEQVYAYQNMGNIYICGDFNGRCGDSSDYVEGVDCVNSRETLDNTSNHYGDLLIQFMTDCNFCMLNGRVNGKNDFTCVSNRGRSVVDYVLVPHEQVVNVSSFHVYRMTETMYNFALNGCDKLSDHSVLLWETCTYVTGSGEINMRSHGNKRYKFNKIPEHFLNNPDAHTSIRETISRIEDLLREQNDVNEAYSMFTNLLHNEVEKVIPKFSNVRNNPRSKYKKYWNDELQNQWDRVCEHERLWLSCKDVNKKRFKERFCHERRTFDKLNRKFKRKQQVYEQKKLQDMLENDISCDFWKEIGKLSLANERHSKIPMEVVDSEGESIFNTDMILNKWKSDYEMLYNPPVSEKFDANHMETLLNELQLETPTCIPHNVDVSCLNRPITYQEVEAAVGRAKLKKACGFDNIPSEILKNGACVDMLYKIVSYCFDKGHIPSDWTKAIINPIPKSVTADPRDPLSYRGISLLSVPYKIYADVLNKRLSNWLEKRSVLADEQNGFRKRRSCLEHIYTLYSKVNNRKMSRLSTFACFIDLKKAFDSVQRDCLWYKLLSVGITGKMFNAIKSLYVDVNCAVRVNDTLTPWFPVSVGLKQGCKISATLFSVYVNDLINEINNLNCGITIDDKMISILAYADDLVLMAPDKDSLQSMLTAVNDWCNKWRLTVNPDKTRIIHFRNPSIPRCDFNFTCGENPVCYTDTYKYLGIWVNEHLNMSMTVTELAKSASRALSALYTKTLNAGGMTYEAYTKLYKSLVEPVLFYAAGVWGVNDHKQIQIVQHKACRYFLGGTKFSANVALRGDMGWNSCFVNEKLECFRLYIKLSRANDDRLLKCVFNWSKSYRRGWESKVEKLAEKLGILDKITNVTWSIRRLISSIKGTLKAKDSEDWLNSLQGSDKLRTYRLYKSQLSPEFYCILPLPRDHRRILFKLRSCSLPLCIETGRYSKPKTPIEQRLCKFCSIGKVEDETHFISDCELYSDIRETLFNKASEINPAFNTFNSEEKVIFLMQSKEMQFSLGTSVTKMFKRRNHFN